MQESSTANNARPSITVNTSDLALTLGADALTFSFFGLGAALVLVLTGLSPALDFRRNIVPHLDRALLEALLNLAHGPVGLR